MVVGEVGKIMEMNSIDPRNWVFDGLPVASDRLKLFDDVSFAYELKLAKMELSRFYDDLNSFKKRTAYFEKINGQKTHHYYLSGVKGKGQIGHTNQYLTHWFYPYKAKFHPQMIKALINWLGFRKGGTLLDPFAGSGTALVEAKTIGVDSIGYDINPLCVLQSKIKCGLLDLSAGDLERVPREEAFHFFDKKAKQRLLRKELFDWNTDKAEEELARDRRVHDFYLLCYLYALSDYTYIKKDMWKAFSANLDGIIKTVRQFDQLKRTLDIKLGKAKVEEADARKLKLPNESIDGIVTSPPYSIAVNYIKNDLHALDYLNIDSIPLRTEMVGLRGNGDERIRLYYQDMKRSFAEMYRVMKESTKCVVVIGDVTYNGKRLDIKDRFIALAKDVGFSCVDLIRRPILGGFARLRYEYIIMFQK